MPKVIFRTLTLIDTSFGQFNVFTFVGKEDGLKKSLKECVSYERVLELLEDKSNPCLLYTSDAADE